MSHNLAPIHKKQESRPPQHKTLPQEISEQRQHILGLEVWLDHPLLEQVQWQEPDQLLDTNCRLQ